MAHPIERKLAAILSADVVGYSRLIAEDEAATIRTLTTYRQEITGLVGDHRGRVVDAPGDNVLAEFPTALDAAECAVEIQRVVQARNASLPEGRRMEFRIGVHLGDVAAEGGRIYGDGVNIAARLESLAEAGGICISGNVYELVRDKVPMRYVDLGEQPVKNLPHPVRVYRVEIPPEVVAPLPGVGSGSRRWAALAGGALLLGVAAVVWWRSTPRSPPPSLATAIVVLPFADLSPDGDQEYFADGMTEELIHTLSKIEDLRVVARTSAFAFKGRKVDIREIGEQLGVGAVVEGSVRKAGERLRITAQLVQVSDGFHLWSETYDRQLDDVFLIQDEIARSVAEVLEVKLLGGTRSPRRPVNLRAYELYLTGRHFWSLRTEAGMRRAVEYYEQALAIDPRYAPALSGLADAYAMLWSYGFDTRPEIVSQARQAATEALRLDPSLGEAHASLGFLTNRLGDWDWEGTEAHYRRALELSPGYATAHQWYATLLVALGRTEEGLAEIRRALELDPLSPIINQNAGQVAFWTGDYEEAIKRMRRAVELSPEWENPRRFLVQVYAQAGLDDEALEALLGLDLPSDAKALLRETYRTLGMGGAAKILLDLDQQRTGQACPVGAAGLYAYAGNAEGVFQCLEEMARRGVFWASLAPVFEPYRSDPRYTAYLRKMGLAE